MSSTSREGVIKFQLDHLNAPSPEAEMLRELNAWRSIFVQLALLGQDPARYEGLGFGNLSRRIATEEQDAFLVSGTQTGHLEQLDPCHYATVIECDPQRNWLRSSGETKPSSEALSHGVLYQANPAICWVMHLHSPEIFTRAARLGLPATSPEAAYGTPEMAAEIMNVATGSKNQGAGLLVMAGHEDGILAYGRTAEEAGVIVVAALARARAT